MRRKSTDGEIRDLQATLATTPGQFNQRQSAPPEHATRTPGARVDRTFYFSPVPDLAEELRERHLTDGRSTRERLRSGRSGRPARGVEPLTENFSDRGQSSFVPDWRWPERNPTIQAGSSSFQT